VRPSELCRSQNYEMRVGADDTQSGRYILKVGIPCPTTNTRKAWEEPERSPLLLSADGHRLSRGCLPERWGEARPSIEPT